MPGVDEFLADPVGFMSKNIVKQMVGGKSVVANTASFTLVKQAESVGTLQNGKKCPVYSMMKASDYPNLASFTSYWCKYEDGKVYNITLAGDAQYMFTANMNGCSFGVGMPAIDGSVRVAHGNDQGDVMDAWGQVISAASEDKSNNGLAIAASFRAEMFKDKAQLQSAQLVSGGAVDGLGGVGGALSRSISPLDYASGGWKSTTFGVRQSDGTWLFYDHLYKEKFINAELLGCFPF